ncbi:MAG: hypothetical protein AB7Q81_13335 [Gammaproteobacteria bacterium]
MPPAELLAYFSAERDGAWLLVAMGIGGLGLATWLWHARHVHQAMAWPLLLFALLELGIGLGLAWRTPAQVATLTAGLAAAPAATLATERARMAAVNRNFRIVKVVETVLIVLGTALVVLGGRASLTGIGLGLVVEAALLLAFDVFAATRAAHYSAWLAAPALGG